MNVHIVLWNDGHIIPKMAQWLVEGNGWTVGDIPDPRADVNYYMPYLMFSRCQLPPTPTAAWFTHYEYGSNWKMANWEQAADFIDLPLVTAPMYCSYLPEARVITPGVDRDFFQPQDVKRKNKPVIGVAGVGQPRKGPKLLIDLLYSDVGAELQIVGDNWPFAHTKLSDDAMPHFYSSLDVYLCSSTIEGIPAPVLEALACDTKVVIPEGVGICSEIDERPGVRHYERGDGLDMVRAIKQCLADEPRPGALREITEQYTIDEWCSSHRVAMEVLVDAAVPV